MNLPKKLRHELRKVGVYLGGLFLLIVIVWLFEIEVVSILTAVALIVVASFSKIYKQFTGKLSLGFELITPVTILFAYKFSILFTLFSAILMLMVSSFIAGKIDFPSTVCEVVTYLILIILVKIFSVVPIVSLGIAMVIVRNMILWPLGIGVLGRNFVHLGIVVVTDAFFNILFFLWLGNFLVGVL